MATINGTNANNTLVGTASSDTISGLAGNDLIFGEAGNDIIIGGTGNDTLYGEGGADTYRFAAGDGNDILYTYGGGGFDVVQFTNIASNAVTLRRSNLEVKINYSGGVLNIASQGIRQVQFSDGITWNVSFNAEEVVNVPATGINLLDGLLSGSTYGSGDGARLTLSFGFPDHTGKNETENGTGTALTLFTASQGYQNAVRDQLARLSALIPVDFVEVVNPAAARLADISFAGMQGAQVPSNLAGYAYYPGASVVLIEDNAGNNFSRGGEYYQVLLHEIGHKLGLKHTFEQSGDFPILDASHDNAIETVMSYNWADGDVFAQTYSVLDVAALQYLYGANTSTNNSNSTYSYNFSASANYFETIWDGGGTDTINLSGSGVQFNLNEGSLNANPNGFGTVSIAYGSVIENLNGSAGNDSLIGNDVANSISGGVGNDTLNGGLGADRLIGGAGNDTYIIDNIFDVVTEGASEGANDIIQSSVNYSLSGRYVETLILTGTANINGTGHEFANTLMGNSGNNILNGGAGADIMQGGTGNDSYYVDNAGDMITEAANSGSDTVLSTISYTLGGNLENLTLLGTAVVNGTGNAIANTLTGNSAANILNGGLGADRLIGGLGDDTFIVDNIGDIVTESNNQGNDVIQASVSYSLSGRYVETLVLTGTAHINATGHEFANTLTGNNGNNILNGGAGADSLNGGLGNDTYIMARGYGLDSITDLDSTSGNLDRLSFAANIAADQLWLTRSGNDLNVSVIGTADSALIKNWYSSTNNRVEQMQSGNGRTLTDSNVQNLVNAMAGMTPPSMGQTTLTAQQHAQLDGVINANWVA